LARKCKIMILYIKASHYIHNAVGNIGHGPRGLDDGQRHSPRLLRNWDQSSNVRGSTYYFNYKMCICRCLRQRIRKLFSGEPRGFVRK